VLVIRALTRQRRLVTFQTFDYLRQLSDGDSLMIH
jgi:hypothetical protein